MRLIILLILFIQLTLPCSAYAGLSDNYKDATNYLDNLLDATNPDASFVINDSVLSYHNNKFFSTINRNELVYPLYCQPIEFTNLNAEDSRVKDLERYLLTAIKMAKEHRQDAPNDYIAILLYTAGFYYRAGNSRLAQLYFQTAIEEYTHQPQYHKLRIAKMQDYLALTMRAHQQYLEAEKIYKQSLEIRQKLLGRKHPTVAKSFYNLAMLYNDAGRKDDQDMLLSAYAITGNNMYLSPTLTPGPRPFNIAAPRSGKDENPTKLVAFAQDILYKYPPAPEQYDKNNNAPGDDSMNVIVGQWKIPKDRFSNKKTKFAQSATSHSSQDNELSSDIGSDVLANVPVYLLSQDDLSEVTNSVKNFAQDKKLDFNKLLKDWLKDHNQAEELIDKMEQEAITYCRQKCQTDETGYLKFKPTDIQDFALFASLRREDKVLFFILTPEKNHDRTIHFTFDDEHATIIWRREVEKKKK